MLPDLEVAVPPEVVGQTASAHVVGYIPARSDTHNSILDFGWALPNRDYDSGSFSAVTGVELPPRADDLAVPFDITASLGVVPSDMSLYLYNGGNGTLPTLLRITAMSWIYGESVAGPEPPLRMRQRDDGLGIDTGHARLNPNSSITPNQPSSSQLGKGRLPERSYS